MEKSIIATLPETREYEEIHIENGIAILRKVKEVITARDIEESVRPINDIKEDYLLCSHKVQIPIFDADYYITMYYTDIMKGKEILRHILTEDNKYIEDGVNVAIVKDNNRIDFEKVFYSPLYLSGMNIRPEREYRFICIHHMPRDVYTFDILKTNSKYFSRKMRVY